MSQAVMEECLEEAKEIWEAFMGMSMVEVREGGDILYAWTQEVATLAVALYQERMRAKEASGERNIGR